MPDAGRERKTGGSASPSLSQSPRKLPEALRRLETAADSFKSPGWFSPRRRRLQALIEALKQVQSLLDAKQDPRLPQVKEFVERGRELLSGYEHRDKDSPSASAIEEFVAKVETLIGELRQSPATVRNEFWK